MNTRCIDPDIKFLMHKSSFLDSRFKTLTYLSATLRDETFDCILDTVLPKRNVSLARASRFARDGVMAD